MNLRDLPKSLQKAIEDMEGAWAKVDECEDCLSWDCFFCELQSSINSAEVNGAISSEAAWTSEKSICGWSDRLLSRQTSYIKRRGYEAPAILLSSDGRRCFLTGITGALSTLQATGTT